MSTTRYVPLGNVSLSTDAPGYEAPRGNTSASKEQGPVCWKCRGAGTCKLKKTKKKRKHQETTAKAKEKPSQELRPCPVCSGSGTLPPKVVSSKEGSKDLPGMITASRRRAVMNAATAHEVTKGPDAFVVGRMKTILASEDKSEGAISEGELKSLKLLQNASQITNSDPGEKVAGTEVPPPPPPSAADDFYPKWMPTNPGEQLCNLVGNWRILQRVGSHRWTTDDIVTAYVASRVCLGLPIPGQKHCPSHADTFTTCTDKKNTEHLRYLDLGTGNASVLQMTCWALWEKFDKIEARGIEARAEAIGLARRSLSFNVGPAALEGEEIDGLERMKSVGIVRSDFRGLSEEIANSTCSGLMKDIRTTTFDLVSGTPPYFEIAVSNDKVKGIQSTIRQGGMPTSVQSAPARCEFRGGVEAYCAAAAPVLSPEGYLVVCVNWLNNHRVYDGAAEAGLQVITALPVKGREGKKEPLFGVYVLKKISSSDIEGASSNLETEVLSPLSVRNQDGEWTDEYEQVMAVMGIPRGP